MTVCSPINKLWKLLILIILEGVVFQLVLWNINRFIAVDVTTFVAISNAILIFFILVASVTAIIFGNVTRSRVYSNLGFVIFLYAIFLFIFIYEGVDVKISAFATLVLAFAAFMAIDENRRLRRENRRIQEETLINERHMLAFEKIRNWAVQTSHALATPNSQVTLTPSWHKEEIAILQSSLVESMSILDFAGRVGGDLEQRVIDANLNFQKYLAILMGEEGIKLFKERYEVEDDIKPITNIEEAGLLIKDLIDRMKEVIRSAVAEMVPKR